MSREDKERWEERYKKGWRSSLHKTLVDFYSLAKVGRGLELACGTGENALFLASKGFQVDAIDISCTAMEMAKQEAKKRGLKVNFICADLESYELLEDTYDLIINFYYLNRDLCPKIVKALKVGGILIFETYNYKHLCIREDFNPEYLLKEGEILEFFKGLEVICYREEFNISTLVGRKVF